MRSEGSCRTQSGKSRQLLVSVSTGRIMNDHANDAVRRLRYPTVTGERPARRGDLGNVLTYIRL
jgi:hypothetical protein